MKLTLGTIKVSSDKNSLLEKIVSLVNSHTELRSLWKINNINAIDRLKYSDHGYTHFQVVANGALKIARTFKAASIEMSITNNYNLPYEYAEVIIFLASVMHDIGMSINREGHEELTLFMARDIMKDILSFLPIEEKTVITAEVLHAILNHRSAGKPITIEAGIVRIADALDMTRGRSRIPYEAGSVNIHSISAYAIEKIHIGKGSVKPVEIKIEMSNSAGLFQIDELLKKKLINSGISRYFEIKAYRVHETEENIIKEFKIDID